MGSKLIKLGAACVVIGLLGYLALPLAWWSLAHPRGAQFPCDCGEQPIEVAAGPNNQPPRHMCLATPEARRIARYQGPSLLPNEIRAGLCDVGIIFGASFVLAAIGAVTLLAGAALRRARPG
jgi:hypothetical protein